MSTEDTLRGMGVGKVAEWNGRLEAVTKERDQLRADLAAALRRQESWHRNFEDADKERQQLRADNEALRGRLDQATRLIDVQRSYCPWCLAGNGTHYEYCAAKKWLAPGSSTGEAPGKPCPMRCYPDGPDCSRPNSHVGPCAPSRKELEDYIAQRIRAAQPESEPAGPESPPAMYTTASPLGPARLSIDEQSAMAVVTPEPASNQCPAWCGKELPPHGVPGYGFLISSGLPSAVGERFKLGRESFVSRAMMRGWCSHECREREVARQGLAPAPASAECPDCKHPSHAANRCQSNAPSGHRCLCLAEQPAISVASWKVPLEESTQGTGAAQFAPTWAQFAALDKRVAALEAGQRILIGGSAPPQTAPVERRAENAPRCCDTACRFFGEKHWTPHEEKEPAPVERHAFVQPLQWQSTTTNFEGLCAVCGQPRSAALHGVVICGNCGESIPLIGESVSSVPLERAKLNCAVDPPLLTHKFSKCRLDDCICRGERCGIFDCGHQPRSAAVHGEGGK